MASRTLMYSALLLAGTFVERMQSYGYFETMLMCRLARHNVKFRFPGWSGDTVWGDARAVFGKRQDGFGRLMKDLRETKPTVNLVNGGANEAHAGASGLADLRVGLNRSPDELETTGARIVLLSPPRRENLPSPLPDATTKHCATFATSSGKSPGVKRRLAGLNPRGPKHGELEILSGRHWFTLVASPALRSEPLRIELSDVDGSTAQVQIVSGK